METILLYIGYFLIIVCWVGIVVGIPLLLLVFIWKGLIAPIISLFSKKKHASKCTPVQTDSNVWYASYHNHNS